MMSTGSDSVTNSCSNSTACLTISDSGGIELVLQHSVQHDRKVSVEALVAADELVQRGPGMAALSQKMGKLH